MSQSAKTAFIPVAVATWAEVLSDPQRLVELRAALASDVEFVFAGRRRLGVDAVVEHFAAAPRAALKTAERDVFEAGSGTWIVRFTGPNGTPLPSPGGPMTALDWRLTLDESGLIHAIGMTPHHTEPTDLADVLGAGHEMPRFTLADVRGEPVAWFDPKAAAHVLAWTCNVCPWALGWHDRIQDVARDYAPRGVRTVQINANDVNISPGDAPTRSRERVDNGDFAGPYLLDAGQRIARQVGARHTPEIFLVDQAGIIRYHGAPDADSENPALGAVWLRDALDAVLGGGSPQPAETEPIGCTIKWTL